MTKKAFDKIADGLKDAAAYVEGDVEKGRVAAATRDPRVDAALAKFAKQADRVAAIDQGLALNKIENGFQLLRKAAKQAEGLPEDYIEVELVQTRGPIVEFTGRMLCEEQWEARRGDLTMQIEVWETQGGAYVAANFSTPKEVAQGFEDARVAVIDPGPDEQARRFAVMDHFGWENRARSMLRKLGWDFRLEVE